MLERIKLAINAILPKKFLTELAGWGASRQGGWLTKALIDLFVWHYKVDMSEARYPDTSSYKTFNEFFTRPLKEGIRPIDDNTNSIIQPADGAISQCGAIDQSQIFQAKGRYYSLEALLAGDETRAKSFINGQFITTYLAPCDYHRVHMPCEALLTEMVYVPGELYSVNPLTAQNINNLFARNERVICYFDTEFGPMVQILVGATIVGSIETSWAGTINPAREGIIRRWRYPARTENGAVILQKGQEMGRFKLGSTVINLFAQDKILLAENIISGALTRLGQPLGTGLAPEPLTTTKAEPPPV